MSSLARRVSRRITHPVRQAAAPAFDQLERRLLLLDEKLDHINHLVATIEAETQENRQQILAARHEAHTLLVTDIDAANEATALLGRSLADHRDEVEDRLERIEGSIEHLTTVVEKLAARLDASSEGRPPG